MTPAARRLLRLLGIIAPPAKPRPYLAPALDVIFRPPPAIRPIPYHFTIHPNGKVEPLMSDTTSPEVPMVEIGGERMTLAQFDAARYPLLNPAPPQTENAEAQTPGIDQDAVQATRRWPEEGEVRGMAAEAPQFYDDLPSRLITGPGGDARACITVEDGQGLTVDVDVRHTHPHRLGGITELVSVARLAAHAALSHQPPF